MRDKVAAVVTSCVPRDPLHSPTVLPGCI